MIIPEGKATLEYSLQGYGELIIDYIVSRPYYSCDVEPDETVFTARYYSGVSISYSSLPIRPVKFCPDSRTAIFIDKATNKERGDIFASTWKKLAAGETIIVPEDQLLEVNYIVDFKEGMATSNCGTGAYFDGSKCIQVVTEKDDVIIVINNVTFITVGKNDILFTDTIEIGDEKIVVTNLKYSGTEKSTPSKNPELWDITVASQNLFKPIDSIDLTWNDEIAVNDYLTLKWVGDAQFKNGAIEDRDDKFILGVKPERNYLKVTSIDTSSLEDKFYTKLKAEASAKVTVDNKLANFDSSQAGYRLIKTRDLLTGQTSTLEQISLPKGVKTIEIPLDTGALGQTTYQVLLFTKFGDEIVYHNQPVIFNYEVYTGQKPTNVTLIIVQNVTETITITQPPITQYIPYLQDIDGFIITKQTAILVGAIIFVVIVSVLLIYFVKKNNKRRK